MHTRANIHHAVSSLTGSSSASQDHVEVGRTRLQTDWRDLEKIIHSLQTKSPFLWSMHDYAACQPVLLLVKMTTSTLGLDVACNCMTHCNDAETFAVEKLE